MTISFPFIYSLVPSCLFRQLLDLAQIGLTSTCHSTRWTVIWIRLCNPAAIGRTWLPLNKLSRIGNAEEVQSIVDTPVCYFQIVRSEPHWIAITLSDTQEQLAQLQEDANSQAYQRNR